MLLFTGLAFSAFGYRFNVMGFFISGIIWILITPYAVKSTVNYEIRKWALIFLIIGGLCGFLAGIIIGESIKPYVGIIGGAVIGGLGMWLMSELIFNSLIIEVFLPKISSYLRFVIICAGGILGIFYFNDSIPKYFETIGGGILVGGTIGILIGIYFGKLIINSEREEFNTIDK